MSFSEGVSQGLRSALAEIDRALAGTVDPEVRQRLLEARQPLVDQLRRPGTRFTSSGDGRWYGRRSRFSDGGGELRDALGF